MSPDPTDAAFLDNARSQMVDQPRQAALAAPGATVSSAPPSSDPAAIVSRAIKAAEAGGLPVRFMLEVQQSGYTIRGGSTDHDSPWFNRIVLTDQTLLNLDVEAKSSPAFQNGLGTLYHEMTHAWFNLNRARPDVAKLRASSITHYRDSPLADCTTGRLTKEKATTPNGFS